MSSGRTNNRAEDCVGVPFRFLTFVMVHLSPICASVTALPKPIADLKEVRGQHTNKNGRPGVWTPMVPLKNVQSEYDLELASRWVITHASSPCK